MPKPPTIDNSFRRDKRVWTKGRHGDLFRTVIVEHPTLSRWGAYVLVNENPIGLDDEYITDIYNKNAIYSKVAYGEDNA